MKSAVLLLALAGFSLGDLIQNLPGQPAANFKQYSGYLTTGTNGRNRMYYWFVESQNQPSTDPLLLWLTGGPGCSGISALFGEWGPFTVNSDAATLSVNPYSWNRNASVLVLESPVGVGFSYTTDHFGVGTSDNQTALENWQALTGFLTAFPQYKTNDFYVTGESYGGIYIPTLVQYILDHQTDYKINIKGMAIGNGLLDDDLDTDGLVEFTHKHGLVDQLQWQQAQTKCCTNGNTDDCPWSTFWNGICHLFTEQAVNLAWRSGLNPYNMYADCVNAQLTSRFEVDHMRKFGVKPHKLSTPPCVDESTLTTYMQRADVRKALGIPDSVPKWEICSDAVSQGYHRQYGTMKPQVTNAVNAGLKVMLYYGDIDMACNFLGGQRFAANLGIAQKESKRTYQVNGQVGGYVSDFGQLKFVTIRGAGHLVPHDKPAVAAYILDAFINNKRF
ncbi:unnamed protein product, partial [Mesorhabditis spiculigera]